MLALAVALIAGSCGGSDASTPAAPGAVGGSTEAAPPRTFKVATWNIRSGMGIRGFSTTSWSHETINCTDRSKPINAWGVGLPQAELERLRDDPAIIALGLQEAWNCGNPQSVNGVMGFKTASGEREGTALLARHGFSGPIKYQEIDPKAHKWVVGGDVCVDAACTATIPMFSAHFGSAPDDEFPNQAQRAIDFLAGQGAARVFMGDLNVYKVDAWNPSVPCTGPDVSGRVRTISMIEGAGYTDAWKATQNGEGWTGMASRPGCGAPLGGLFKRIDYVYTVGLRTLSTNIFARAAPAADSPSDHAGLVAELSTLR